MSYKPVRKSKASPKKLWRMTINFPFTTKLDPLFNVGLVLFLGAGSPGCHEDVGNVSRNVVVFEGDRTHHQLMVNKIDRPNTTPTVRAICLPFIFRSSDLLVASLLFMHRRYCIIRRKLEPLDCAMADLKRSKLCVISAVIFS